MESQLSSEIPDFVWRAILSLAMRVVVPLVIVLALIGAAVLAWLWKKGSLPFMGDSRKQKGDNKRRDDELIQSMIEQNSEWLERWVQSQEKVRESLDGWANVLRALTGEIVLVGRTQKDLLDSFHIGIRGTHERLDKLVERRP